MRISRVPIVARMQIVMGSPLIRRSLFSSNRSPQTIELGQPYSTDQIFDPFLAAIGCLCRVSIHARARTHTEVRCRCSFESFRDNSSRQINLFSPRSNLFSLRETCFYISKSRRSLPGAPLPFGVGNRAVTPATYIYIFFHRNYEATRLSLRFFFDFRDHAFLLRCSSLPLSSRIHKSSGGKIGVWLGQKEFQSES